MSYKKQIAIIFIALIGVYYLYRATTYYRIIASSMIDKTFDTRSNPVYDGEVEPPMPNLFTITPDDVGVDLNKNGIRDDVDIWINRTGKNYNQRMSLRQYARASEKFLLNCKNKDEKNLQAVIDEWSSGKHCLWLIYDPDNKLKLDELPHNSINILFGWFYSKRYWDYLNHNSPTIGYDDDSKKHLICKFNISQER